MIAELYAVAVSTVNYHLKRVLDDLEVDEASIREFLIDVSGGRKYRAKHYGLRVVLAVGFKIENERAVQFRKWAGEVVKEYTGRPQMR
ncbi:MAG: virulence RhuM family protein [Propionibacteriaceae bacterium]|jgi:hypothetical protein|nr:virulence RhuM family protein [Propionibacteriaceae bacterium]